MDKIDFTTPRTAAHDIKEAIIEMPRLGRPFRNMRDRKARIQLIKDRANGDLPAGIQSVINTVEHFNDKPKV